MMSSKSLSLVLIEVVQVCEHSPQHCLQLAQEDRYCLSMRGIPGLRGVESGRRERRGRITL
jgi:hypothetical protein